MSAYMCSDLQIARLARAISEKVKPPGKTEDEIATELTRENQRSLMARYGDPETDVTRAPGFVQATLAKYPEGYVFQESGIDLAGCYRYQACETDDWPQSVAYGWLEDLGW